MQYAPMAINKKTEKVKICDDINDRHYNVVTMLGPSDFK